MNLSISIFTVLKTVISQSVFLIPKGHLMEDVGMSHYGVCD